MIFLPVYFICVMSGQCDFALIEAVSSESECIDILKEKDAYLSNDKSIRKFKSICVQIDNAILIQKKGNV